MPALELDNLRKTYPGGVEALRGIDLRVEPGEMVALIGPSGCGKTTLLRLVAGLEQVSAGTILLRGCDATRLPPRDRDVAMVFQEDAIYPHLTVRGNLELRGRLQRRGPADLQERVRLAAELLRLEALLDRRPATLSGGERRRVALGRAVAAGAGIVLLDEPLAGLDAPLRLELRVELKVLQRRLGWTVLYVTHDQAEALALGDRVGVMAAGALRQVGTPVEVLDRPADRFVAGFLNDPPMNFLEGAIDAGPRGMVFSEPSGARFPMPQTTGAAGPAVMGFRATALAPAPDAPNDRSLAVEIIAVDIAGNRTDLFGRTRSGAPICARLEPPGEWTVGQAVQLRVDPRAIRLFETGPGGRAILDAI